MAVPYELVTRAEQAPTVKLRLVNKFPSVVPVGDDKRQDLASALRSVLESGGASPAEAAQLRIQLGRILISVDQGEAGLAELAKAVTHPGLDALDRARAMILLGWPSEHSQPAWVHRRWLRRAGRVLATIEPSRWQLLAVDRATALLLLGEDEGWAAVTALDAASTALPPAQITFEQDTPYTPTPENVTMTVTPPKSWGKIAGTLQGTDCSGVTAPLQGEVFANGSMDFSLPTPADGSYAFRAPRGKFTLIATATGWQPVTRTASIKARTTNTQNFTLHPVAAC